MKHIAMNNKEPWVLLGDINASGSVEESIGSMVKIAEIKPMVDCMTFCNLVDVKASGRHFTRNNKYEENQRVFSRIDRIITNHERINTYDMAEANFLPEGNFDHTPVFMGTTKVC